MGRKGFQECTGRLQRPDRAEKKARRREMRSHEFKMGILPGWILPSDPSAPHIRATARDWRGCMTARTGNGSRMSAHGRRSGIQERTGRSTKRELTRILKISSSVCHVLFCPHCAVHLRPAAFRPHAHGRLCRNPHRSPSSDKASLCFYSVFSRMMLCKPNSKIQVYFTVFLHLFSDESLYFQVTHYNGMPFRAVLSVSKTPCQNTACSPGRSMA